ncbi:carbonic anhydrase [Desulfobacterota bacterium AH_259_B03_O07]|nr:carbonic anhydrase [Desulfobacterota bacterium AH_259_B03_O07]
MQDSKFISRRNFVRVSGAAAIGASFIKFGDDLLLVREASAEQASKPKTPVEALKKLMEGNRRFVDSLKKSPRRTVEVRKEVAQEQTPFAAILACADSRVAPEIIFDQGIGDLFVVRVAGNVVNPSNYGVLGSLEFGVLALGASVIMVLGHSRCGAVAGAIEGVQKGTEFPGSINNIVNTIGPAVEAVKDEPGDLLDNSIVSNVKLGVDKLKGSVPVLADKVREGKVKIVGANYDLFTGEVKIVT